jgi:hypothetical protein
MTTLRVLVTEDERGAADLAVDELVGAGHEVLRCHPPGTPAFPCAALRADGRCPLRTGYVDLTLAVRHNPGSMPSRGEDGVLCSIRHHVPVVVAGAPVFDPFEEWETEVLNRPYGVVDTCERVAAAPLPHHTRVAADALHEVVRTRAGSDQALLVAVHRVKGALDVEIRAREPVAKKLQSMIAVRVVAALRAFDQDATGIDARFVELAQ